MDEQDKDTKAIDAMFEYGAEALSLAAEVFLREAERRGVSKGEAILCFASILITKGTAVMRAMVPKPEALELCVKAVHEAWEEAMGDEGKEMN